MDLAVPATEEYDDATLTLEAAAMSERLNFLAVRQGLPAIGSLMENPYGISWCVIGHAYAKSVSTLGITQGQHDLCDLYPVSIPQNLSPRLIALLAEIDLCTPKASCPLTQCQTSDLRMRSRTAIQSIQQAIREESFCSWTRPDCTKMSSLMNSGIYGSS
jgi:hypothetical protein